MSDIIKTTARFQEPNEPIKQKPIIQIDTRATALPNTIRASLDTGRDNPFRPDGAIYRSADPIVDYYKYGANQSRAQSPTDSQLLLNGGQKDKKKRKGQQEGMSCWRRWLCCCCCCCKCFSCCKKKEEEENKETTDEATRIKIILPKEEQDKRLEENERMIEIKLTKDSKQQETKIVGQKERKNISDSGSRNPADSDAPDNQQQPASDSGQVTQVQLPKESRCNIS